MVWFARLKDLERHCTRQINSMGFFMSHSRLAKFHFTCCVCDDAHLAMKPFFLTTQESKT